MMRGRLLAAGWAVEMKAIMYHGVMHERSWFAVTCEGCANGEALFLEISSSLSRRACHNLLALHNVQQDLKGRLDAPLTSCTTLPHHRGHRKDILDYVSSTQSHGGNHSTASGNAPHRAMDAILICSFTGRRSSLIC